MKDQMNNIDHFQEHHLLELDIFRHRRLVDNLEKVFVRFDFARCC